MFICYYVPYLWELHGINVWGDIVMNELIRQRMELQLDHAYLFLMLLLCDEECSNKCINSTTNGVTKW